MKEYKDYAPYFRNGLLYLTEKTVNLLTDAGLEKSIGQAALKGLALDDNKAEIAKISSSLEQVLAQMEEDTQAFQALNSSETHFILTGKPGAPA